MNTRKSRKNNQKIFIFLVLVISAIILLVFLIRISNAGYGLYSDNVNFEVTGQIGDYIGGVIGTIFTGAGFYFLYVTLKDQRETNQKNSFESKFFELIRLHRENISEIHYTKFYIGEKIKSENRKVFKVIVNEFIECLREVRHFTNSKNVDDFYNKEYKQKVENLIRSKKIQKVSLIEYATIELAYSIIYFGLNSDGKIILREMFARKYKNEYLYHLIRYMELKPKEEYEKNYSFWKELYSKQYNEFEVMRKNIYFSDKPKYKRELFGLEKRIFENYSLKKYYGGHQHRLGHYFRHLYQSYSFLDNQEHLDDDEKRFYGKLLRAQLSTSEQYLLFLNSITCLGHKWELNNVNSQGKDIKLITFYSLIANLPGKHISGIYYSRFYPEVKYESNDYQ